MRRSLSGLQKNKFDVVVVGAGLGGLSCGALLAKEGIDVLVIDQRPSPGGVCHSYVRDGYTIDVGPHLLSGCGANGVVTRQLKELGTLGDVEFLTVDPLAKVVFPDYSVHVPGNYGVFIDKLAERYPHQRQFMTMLFREMEQVYRDIDTLPSSFGILDFLKVPVNQPVFLKYPAKTYQDMMDEFQVDRELQSIISALWVYFGLPQSEISAVFWSVVMSAYFLSGGHYPRGGIGTVAKAYQHGLESHGGVFLPNTLVERILVEDGKAIGVEVTDVSHYWTPVGSATPEYGKSVPGQLRASILADTVISNGDAHMTLGKLVGQQHLPPKYVAKLNSVEPSLSLIKVALGVDVDVRQMGMTDHDVVFFDSYDMDAIFRKMKTQLPDAPCDVTIPTNTDPSLAPRGHHVMYLWNYVPISASQNWAIDGERVAQRMIGWTERFIPGLSKHIVLQNIMNPETIQQYALTTAGAPYGWTFTPDQMGFKRFQPRTPIKNLYLAGHWTTPGAGVAGVVMSGANVAKIVLEKEGWSLWRASA